MRLAIVAVLAAGVLGVHTARAADDPASLVDPFVGTGGDAGHTFPGAVVPHGIVQFSPVSARTASPGGYRYDDRTIRGFALTRLSGAGCVNLGDLPIMPLARPFERLTPGGAVPPASFRHQRESASPGRYRVTLDDGIRADLTATLHTAAATFTFPSRNSYLALDAGGGSTRTKAISLQLVGSHELDGSITSGGFCDGPATPTIYFVVRFDQPVRDVGSWGDDGVVQGGVSDQAATKAGGALLRFTASQVRMKAGVSYVSVQNAARNLQAEDNGWNFTEIAAHAWDAWDRLLGRITVRGGRVGTRRTFYTALYHALIHPTVASDVDGQFRRRDGAVGRALGYRRMTNISGWDIYRTQLPLLALIEPDAASDLVRSIVAGFDESGTVAKWEYAGVEDGIMVGDPAAPIIAGAYAFGARQFDIHRALSALDVSAQQPSPGPFVYPSNLVPTDGTQFGPFVDRPDLADYLNYGYVPYDETAGFVWGPASTTLEYETADFALSRLAAAAGDRLAALGFLRRASGWRRLFNPGSGYLEPRNANGSFLAGYSDASKIGFVEGNASQYTWMVPYDLAGLVRTIGTARSETRLDSFLAQLNTNRSSPHAWLGNEPSFGTPYAYLWLDRPSKTQATVRRALTTLFHPWPAGLPGDDDLGAMSAWYVWSSLGLYPAIPGVGGLAITAPLFSSATVHSGTRDISITTTGRGRYVRSLSANGRPHSRTWLQLGTRGSTHLQFDLAPRPQAWGSGRRDAPPSFEAGK
jgi:predicted alpha-1,2-mannosidase